MEAVIQQSYINFLLQLLNKESNIDNKENKESLELNIYLTLLALSNCKYDESLYQKEIDKVETFLRKVNNLKVKIQLKRKEEEINKLTTEIKEIYTKNKDSISKYNKANLDIENILNSNNAPDLTLLIDKLTKEKMKKIEKKETHDVLRKKIKESLFISDYYIDKDMLYIEKNEKNDSIQILLSEFYEIFEYLLNIDTYKKIFPNNNSSVMHLTLIGDIIKKILTKETIDNEIIPIVLTYLITKNIPNYENIDTSNFNINNIKITDLYSFAENNDQIENQNTARWKKILIPNEYLYKKIKEIAIKGMYYFQEDKFILENIENATSDFKISIEIDKMLEFLKENLQNLSKNELYKKA